MGLSRQFGQQRPHEALCLTGTRASGHEQVIPGSSRVQGLQLMTERGWIYAQSRLGKLNKKVLLPPGQVF